MGTLGVIAGICLAIAGFAAALAGFFIWVGAKMAGVEKATFWKAILAAVGSNLMMWILSMVCSVVLGVGTVIGGLIGLLGSLWVIKAVFHTTLGKAFGVWVFHVFAEVLALVISLLTFGGALVGLLGL